MKTNTKPTSNEAENGNKSKPLLAVVSWQEREKYGCLGNYIINNDIYQDIPKYWKQEPKLLFKKGTLIKVVEYKDRNVYEDQFVTLSGFWFKKHQITPVS